MKKLLVFGILLSLTSCSIKQTLFLREDTAIFDTRGNVTGIQFVNKKGKGVSYSKYVCDELKIDSDSGSILINNILSINNTKALSSATIINDGEAKIHFFSITIDKTIKPILIETIKLDDINAFGFSEFLSNTENVRLFSINGVRENNYRIIHCEYDAIEKIDKPEKFLKNEIKVGEFVVNTSSTSIYFQNYIDITRDVDINYFEEACRKAHNDEHPLNRMCYVEQNLSKFIVRVFDDGLYSWKTDIYRITDSNLNLDYYGRVNVFNSIAAILFK